MSNHPSISIHPLVRRILVGGSAAGMLALGTVAPAMAAEGSDSGTTVGHVAVDSDIVLTGLTDNFTLTGIPGATVTGLSAVTLTVATNNFAGYGVTVQSRSATMDPGAPGNTDSIPIGALSVRETGTTPFTPLSTGTATVHAQATRSAPGGDALSNDYQVVIPFVNQDTYAATLDYVATAL